MTHVSVILPTYNESHNIQILIPQLVKVFQSHKQKAEIIIVDDNSSDGTARYARQLTKRYRNLRVFVRKNERGLSSAVLFGMKRCRGTYIVVMDADLQHNEKYIAKMLTEIKRTKADICVGSRTVAGGSYGKFNIIRITLSKIATTLANFFLPFTLKDPMSGFFIIRKSHYKKIQKKISPIGFKILLDILNAYENTKVVEVPIIFRIRKHGKTKVGLQIVLSFLYALIYYSWKNFLKSKLSFAKTTITTSN